MIKAGKLNQKVEFFTPTEVLKDSGGRTTSFVSFLNTFAEVREVRSDAESSDARVAIATALSVVIRYRPTLYIKNGDKMVWRGLEFIVDNIKVDTMRTTIEIMVNTAIETSKRSSEEVVSVHTFDTTFDITFK